MLIILGVAVGISMMVLFCRGNIFSESTGQRMAGKHVGRCYRNIFAEYTFGIALGVASANERFLREDLFFESGIIAMFRLCEEVIVGLSEEEAVRIAEERRWEAKVVDKGFIAESSVCPLSIIGCHAGSPRLIIFEVEDGIVVRIGFNDCCSYYYFDELRFDL